MKSLRLADTSIKAYKKRNRNISLHLSSFLMVISKGGGYNLTHYLKSLRCFITFEDGNKIELDKHSISVNCDYGFNTMAYNFKSSTIMGAK